MNEITLKYERIKDTAFYYYLLKYNNMKKKKKKVRVPLCSIQVRYMYTGRYNCSTR